MKYFVLTLLSVWLLAGSSCKQPTDNKPPSGCDTCSHACDTCQSHSPNDSSSHAFTWSIYHLPTNQVQEGDVKSSWVFGHDNIYFNNTYLYKYNGATIQKVFLWTSEGGELKYLGGSRLFAFDTSDFWLVEGGIVDHVDGRRYNNELVAWTTRLDSTGVWNYRVDGGVNAAWGTSSRDIFFVGDKGTILHFDGTNWIKYPKVTDVKLFSVWGTRHSDVWACGYDQSLGTSTLVHFDGTAWAVDSLGALPLSKTGGIYTVWACDSATHNLVFANGGYLFRETDQQGWYIQDGSQAGTDIGLVWSTGNSANDYLLSGGWGLTMHWNGRSWHRFDELFDEGAADFTPHAAHMKGNTACIVGRKNGTSWVAIGQR
jgi:hypothetical protein